MSWRIGLLLGLTGAVHISVLDKSTIGVSWTTESAVTNATVLIGGSQTVAANSFQYTAGDVTHFAHRAAVPVQPGQTITYKVGPPFTGATYTAKAPPVAGASIRLAALGDSGSFSFPGTGANLTYPWLQAYLSTLDAIVHVGDLAYDRGNEKIWDDLFIDI